MQESPTFIYSPQRCRSSTETGAARFLSERHVLEVLAEYVNYFNYARPHQGLDQSSPGGTHRASSAGEVITFPVLGGFHHDYRRSAWVIFPTGATPRSYKVASRGQRSRAPACLFEARQFVSGDDVIAGVHVLEPGRRVVSRVVEWTRPQVEEQPLSVGGLQEVRVWDLASLVQHGSPIRK